jgi:hypothetical protein
MVSLVQVSQYYKSMSWKVGTKRLTDILNRQYQSVFTNEDTSDLPTPDGKPYSSMPEITATSGYEC